MNPATREHGGLETAFRHFERAAASLEERHGALQSEVERLERLLLEANHRLEAVLDALEDGVAVVTREGRLAGANRSFARMQLHDADGRPTHPELVRLLEADPRRGSTVGFRWEGPAGPRDLVATLVSVGGDDATRVLTVKDTTQIRREEQEGGRRRRLEALGRMAAELAHEVRNPLGSIRLFANMLQEDLADRPEPRAMVEQILAATTGLEGTVANLLAFAAPARGTSRQFDLARLAAEACSLLGPACAVRGVTLAGPASDARCAMRGDPEALRQVVLNLLGNALAATEAGGWIRVTVRRSGDQAVLAVEDDGRGIAPADLPRVFDPFFSRTAGGTGLGLSIVHQAVERHGGRVTLDSQPGRGTAARVELPLPREAAAAEQAHA